MSKQKAARQRQAEFLAMRRRHSALQADIRATPALLTQAVQACRDGSRETALEMLRAAIERREREIVEADALVTGFADNPAQARRDLVSFLLGCLLYRRQIELEIRADAGEASAVDLTLLGQVREAMERWYQENNFGICVACEQHIAEQRLRAIPWAIRCDECQEKLGE